MKHLIQALSTAFVLSLSSMNAYGASPDSSMTQFYSTLTVQSSPESARVAIDGVPVGFTPCKVDSILPGTHVLTLHHPDVESWLTEPVSDSVRLVSGEHRTLRFDLNRWHIIATSPFGAEVVWGDSIIGTTPLTVSPDLAQHSLLLRKPGYEPSRIDLSASGVVSVPLKRIWQNDGTDDSIFKTTDGSSKKDLGLYISGAATIIGGVTAAYLKTRADGKYHDYLLTGNRQLLTDTRRLDTAAGIAIVATQIGLGLFTYLILSQ